MSTEDDIQKQADAPKPPAATEVEIERVRGGFIVTHYGKRWGNQSSVQEDCAIQSVASDFNGAVRIAAELLGVER